MKSLADFTKKSKVAEANITRDKFYKNEVYKKGEWVLTEQGQVGKIHRRVLTTYYVLQQRTQSSAVGLQT